MFRPNNPSTFINKLSGYHYYFWVRPLPYVFFSLVFFLVLSPLWLLTRELRWDGIDYFLPMAKFTIDAFREGRFPLWEPSLNCGLPLHAEPSLSTTNPLLQVLAVLPLDSGSCFVLFFLFHWWLSGIGMIWLSKMYGSTALGATVSGFAFAFSGYFVGHAEHIPMVITGGVLPFLIGYSELGLKSSWRFFCPAAFFYSWSCMGGYPPLTAFSGLAVFFWLFLRYPEKWRELLLGLSFVGFSGIVTYLPVLHSFKTEGLLHTNRTGPIDINTAVNANPFSILSFFSLILPQSIFFIKKLGSDISMSDGYVGCLSIPLFFGWLKTRADKKFHFRFLLFAVFMFLVSLGGIGGLRYILYFVFPPLQYVRYNGIFRLYWIFVLTLYSGIAISSLHSLLDDSRAKRKLIDVFRKFGFVSILTVFIFIVHQMMNHSTFLRLSVYLPFILVYPIALWILMTEKFSSRMKVILFAVLAMADFLGHLKQNIGLVWEGPEQLARITAPTRKSAIYGEPSPRDEILSYINMEEEDFQRGLAISEYATVLKAPFRFWISPTAHLPTSRAESLEVLTHRSVQDPVPIFIDSVKNISMPVNLKPVVPGSFGRAITEFYSPEKVQVRVSVPGSEPVILASSERWSAGWRVAVDDVSTDSLVMNLYFRAAVIPPGDHLVTWTYQPEFWGQLLLLSRLFLALLIFFIAFAFFLKPLKR